MALPTATPVAVTDWITLSFRLLLAVSIGAAIGWNRELRGKAAGLRTHMLVSLGAALFVIVPLEMGRTALETDDAASRAIQGIATGVGFLGAGEIIHESRGSSNGHQVKGLTSAAAIWVTAALGVTSAYGMWQLSLLGVGLTLFILIGAKWLERRLVNRREED